MAYSNKVDRYTQKEKNIELIQHNQRKARPWHNLEMTFKIKIWNLWWLNIGLSILNPPNHSKPAIKLYTRNWIGWKTERKSSWHGVEALRLSFILTYCLHSCLGDLTCWTFCIAFDYFALLKYAFQKCLFDLRLNCNDTCFFFTFNLGAIKTHYLCMVWRSLLYSIFKGERSFLVQSFSCPWLAGHNKLPYTIQICQTTFQVEPSTIEILFKFSRIQKQNFKWIPFFNMANILESDIVVAVVWILFFSLWMSVLGKLYLMALNFLSLYWELTSFISCLFFAVQCNTWWPNHGFGLIISIMTISMVKSKYELVREYVLKKYLG